MELTYAPAVLLDLDGTLVDSVYHHVLAWDRALSEAGYQVPLWRIRTATGMGSDRLLPWLLGRRVDEADELADAHTKLFAEQADRLRPTDGALALLGALGRDDVPSADADAADVVDDPRALVGRL